MTVVTLWCWANGQGKTQKVWINNGIQLLSKSNLDKDHKDSWAAYHASRQEQSTDLPAITALLPLFNEKSDLPVMAKHTMKIMHEVTEFLNPGQISVIAGNCPNLSTYKYVQ